LVARWWFERTALRSKVIQTMSLVSTSSLLLEYKKQSKMT